MPYPSVQQTTWEQSPPNKHEPAPPPVTFPLKTSRRTKQCFAKQIKRQETELARKEHETWQIKFEQKLECIVKSVHQKLKSCYGFVADETKTTIHNAKKHFENMEAWYYFNRPCNITFHDLTEQKCPIENLQGLLGLGLKFCPAPKYSNTDINNTLERFEPDLRLKAAYGGSKRPDKEGYNKRMHVKSQWTPPNFMLPYDLPTRLQHFRAEIQTTFGTKKHVPSNLLPHQRHALRLLRQNREYLIVACDKNLGPAVIERERYIKMAMSEHLLDNTTYKKISPAEAEKTATAIKQRIKGWIRKHLKPLNPTESKFLRHHLQENTEPWCTFYLLM